mmetsp:Transcript_46801/g.85676  ORF Transcript_46801/g.85676 Transcript_46801/m.85676 type:complete len:413 (-) Transcript_46801:112-1350(-)
MVLRHLVILSAAFWLPLGVHADGSHEAISGPPPQPTKVIFPADYAAKHAAQCLDQSPAGYYIRLQDPKRWVIYLQGGGLCVEVVDCITRTHSALGSSTKWPAVWKPAESPIFSTEPTAVFKDFSQVYIPYCSGDMWLGTDRSRRIRIGELQMSGHLILEAVLEHLSNNTLLTQASEVYITGSSAGGVGTIQHADWFREKLPQQKVVAMPSAGMFFPHGWPVIYEGFAIGITTPVDNMMAKWCHLLEGGFLHPDCVAAAEASKKSTSTCFDVSNVLPYVKTDLFILNAQFDALQVHDLGLCPSSSCTQQSPSTSTSGQFIRLLGQRMNETLHDLVRANPRVGIFLPAWFDHDEWLREEIAGRGPSLEGISLKDAVEAWSHEQKEMHLFGASCNDKGPCPLPTQSRLPEGAIIV